MEFHSVRPRRLSALLLCIFIFNVFLDRERVSSQLFPFAMVWVCCQMDILNTYIHILSCLHATLVQWTIATWARALRPFLFLFRSFARAPEWAVRFGQKTVQFYFVFFFHDRWCWRFVGIGVMTMLVRVCMYLCVCVHVISFCLSLASSTTTRRSGNMKTLVAGILCHFQTAIERDGNDQKNVRISTIIIDTRFLSHAHLYACAFFFFFFSLDEATKKSSTRSPTHHHLLDFTEITATCQTIAVYFFLLFLFSAFNLSIRVVRCVGHKQTYVIICERHCAKCKYE